MHAPRGPTCSSRSPARAEGLPAIEEAIFAGVPINVTLLFSTAHYLAAAEAWLRGIERRLAAGLSPDVGSVASLFVSRWDVAVTGKLPAALHMKLGIAVGRQAYKAYGDWLASARVRRVMNEGAVPQRLLLASTGTKDPKASDTLYIEATGRALHRQHHARRHAEGLRRPRQCRCRTPADGGDCEAVLAGCARRASTWTRWRPSCSSDGAASFVKSWHELLGVIASKSASLA
jgi:transaldolase